MFTFYHNEIFSQSPDFDIYYVYGGSENVDVYTDVEEGEVIQVWNYVQINSDRSCANNDENGFGNALFESNSGGVEDETFTVWQDNTTIISYILQANYADVDCDNYIYHLYLEPILTYEPNEYSVSGEIEANIQCSAVYSVPSNNNPWVYYDWHVYVNNVEQFGIIEGESTNEIIVNWPNDAANNNGIVTCKIRTVGHPEAIGSEDRTLYSDSMNVNISDLNDANLNGFTGTFESDPFCGGSGQIYEYELSPLPPGYASSTSWEVPFGWNITSTIQSIGSSKITVEHTSNALSGNVLASIHTGCGDPVVDTLAVGVTPPLPSPPSIQGPTTVCAHTGGYTFSIPPVPNANYYNWTYNGDPYTSGPNQIEQASVSFSSPGEYTITVTPSGPCGSGDPSTIVVNAVEGIGFTSVSELAVDDIDISTHLGNGQPIQLLMNPCETISQCTNRVLDEAFLDIQLDLGELYEYGANTFNSTVEVRVDMYADYTGGSPIFTEDIVLDITELSPRALFHKEITNDFQNIKRYDIYITSYQDDDFIDQSIRLQASYKSKYKQDVRSATSLIDTGNLSATISPIGSTKYRFDWSLTCSDLVIKNYQIQVLKLEDTNDDIESYDQVINSSSTSQMPSYYVDWSKALTIETQSWDTHLDLTLTEGSGYYLWRVRPIGDFFEGGIADFRNWGQWSGSYEDGSEINTTPNGFSVINYTQFDEERNWIYSRVFVEGDLDPAVGVKMGETMNFANGLNQSLINQTLSNENGLIVNQSLYDFSGRAAMQTLPVPISGVNVLGFNVNQLMKDTIGSLYGAKNFDECENWNDPEPVDDVNTFQSYYSDLNMADPIADAEGYPFTRTLLANDGRVKEQSAPGGTLRLKMMDSHTTRTYFSGVMEDELLRVFGEESPVASNVQKVITVDPNGVASGVYVSKAGQTLATFLINNGTNEFFGNTEADLANVAVTSGNLLHGLSSKESSFLAQEIIDNHMPGSNNSVISTTKISTAEPNIDLSIDYSITPQNFENSCTQIQFCTTCDYNVRIKVLPDEVDLCAPGGLPIPIFDSTLVYAGSNTISDCTAPIADSFTTVVSLDDPGSYIIFMEVFTENIDSLSIDSLNPSGTSYLSQGLVQLQNMLSVAYEVGIFDNLNGILNDGEQSLLASWNTTDGFNSEINPEFSLDAMYELWLNPDSLSANVIMVTDSLGISFSYTPPGFCESISIPYLPCELDDSDCEMLDPEMDFNDYWSLEFPNLDTVPDGFVQPVFADLFSDPDFTPAAFKIMIQNMLLEERSYLVDGVPTVERLYSCSEIISCWENVRNNYFETILSYAEAEESSDVELTYSIINEFLACTGTNYFGYTNISSIESGTVYGINLASMTDYVPSYVTHAYSYFKLDQVITDFTGDNMYFENCYNDCPIEEGDNNLLQCVIPDGNNQTFLDNHFGTYSTVNDFTEWSWNDLDLLTPEQSNNFWLVFNSCNLGISEGMDLPSITTDELNELQGNVNGGVINQCFETCNGLYDGFYQSVVDEYHSLGLYAEFDQYVMQPEFHSIGDFDAYDDYLIANGLTFPADFGLIYSAFVNENIINDQGTPETSDDTVVQTMGWTPYVDNSPNSQYLLSSYTIPHEMLVGSCEISCLVSGIMDHCKSTCDLSWANEDSNGDGNLGDIPVGVDGEITPESLEQLLAVQEVITSTAYDISFPDQNGECADGYDFICVYGQELVLGEESTGGGICEDCGLAPNNVEMSNSINAALNNFVPFLNNSLSIAENTGELEFMPLSGWSSVGSTFRWQWNHPYFQIDPDCTLDGVTIELTLEAPDGPIQPIAMIQAFESIGYSDFEEFVATLTLYNVKISLGDIQDDVVLWVQGSQNIGGTVQDWSNSVPFGFTNSHFSLFVNELDKMDIAFPPGASGFHGSFNDGSGNGYVRRWNILEGNVNCVVPVDSTDLAYNECVPFYNLIPFCEKECPGTFAEICFKWGRSDTTAIEWEVPEPILCEEENTNQLFIAITEQIQNILTEATNDHYTQYVETCANALAIDDTLKYSMEFANHHYTLYYYDRAGNLIQTVPPEGVNLQDEEDGFTSFERDERNHRMATTYAYNSYNQLIQQNTPDGGVTTFVYDDIQLLRFSQNAQQAVDGEFSYSKYDELARIIEVGVCEGSYAEAQMEENLNNPSYPNSNLKEVTKTTYSKPSTDPIVSQNLLENRVSFTVRIGDGGDGDVKTIYSYDTHGNVNRLYQLLPGLDMKTTDYSYDLVSGNVLEVCYQANEPDQFFHRYNYDADNRLTTVETSMDGVLWETDAEYDYYIHGPLKRSVIGQDKVQGMDYVYTLNGWLKMMNHPDLDPLNDISADGQFNSSVAKDVFGMQLNYFSGDYKRTTGYGTVLDSDHGNTAGLGGGNLYNGNISSWMAQVAYPSDATETFQYENQMTARTFKYDELNRLVQSNFNGHDGSNWQASNDYHTYHRYDANGNLEQLSRTAYGVGNMDDLSYKYNSNDSGEKINNKLYHYGDAGTDNVYDDLKPIGAFDDANEQSVENNNNYGYDKRGNLIWDNEENIDTITWLANGKIESIIHEGGIMEGPDLYFMYDAQGNRIAKRVVSKDVNGNAEESNSWNWTYYVRDASGNVMGIYDKTNVPNTPVTYESTTTLSELPLYGSARLGLLKPNRILEVKELNNSGVLISTTPFMDDEIENMYRRKLNSKNYELSDHLGNVRATITDIKEPENFLPSGLPTTFISTISSSNSYYPFGMIMPGRNYSSDSYRYGFQGQEKDDEVKGSGNSVNYKFRMHDPRLGRFFSVDPLTYQYPHYTPYSFSGNKLISAIELEGLEELELNENNDEIEKTVRILKRRKKPLIRVSNTPKFGSRRKYVKGRYWKDPKVPEVETPFSESHEIIGDLDDDLVYSNLLFNAISDDDPQTRSEVKHDGEFRSPIDSELSKVARKYNDYGHKSIKVTFYSILINDPDREMANGASDSENVKNRKRTVKKALRKQGVPASAFRSRGWFQVEHNPFGDQKLEIETSKDKPEGGGKMKKAKEKKVIRARDF